MSRTSTTAFKEHPISFALPQLLPILNLKPGTRKPEAFNPAEPIKWQDRRVIQPQPLHLDTDPAGERPSYHLRGKNCIYTWPVGENPTGQVMDSLTHDSTLNFRGVPGDFWWVREPWGQLATRSIPPGIPHVVNPHRGSMSVVYQAGWPRELPAPQWKNPRCMPQWASRIKLLIQEVRVERVADITEESAMAEGCYGCTACGQVGYDDDDQICAYCDAHPYWASFKSDWDSRHAGDEVGKNRFVFVYSFTRWR